MKSFLLMVAGVTAALAYLVAKQQRTDAKRLAAPVEDLAHKLQDAWADHHTVA